MPSKDKNRNNENYRLWYERNRAKVSAKKHAYRHAKFEEHKGWNEKAKLKRRQLIANYKMERGCAHCGYKAHPEALHFDHLPGTTKKDQISYLYRSKWLEVLAEIEKCQVLCANCHAIETSVRRKQAKQAKREEKKDPQLRLNLG